MFKSVYNFALGAMVSVLMLGCVDSPAVRALPELTFENVAPVYLNASHVSVINAYQSPMKSPYIEYNYKLPPVEAVKRLLEKQLIASAPDANKTLRIIIEDGSVVKENLQTTPGIRGVFTQEAIEKFKGKISLRFELFDDSSPDIVIGHAQVVADRNASILKDASPAERDQVFFNLTEAMTNDVQAGINTIVRNTFGVH